ncbi:uncharacterized protein EI90DRAFT_3051173, partial [Cantharellus anzutake]|uniref:uncharacterized protein n=1 Tax=Cantharellus anzutake TaxID=1750568 RepID=UPI0019054584
MSQGSEVFCLFSGTAKKFSRIAPILLAVSCRHHFAPEEIDELDKWEDIDNFGKMENNDDDSCWLDSNDRPHPRLAQRSRSRS